MKQNTETKPSQAIERISLDPQALIQSAIDKGAGIETLERLVALAKDVQTERARQAWYSAMSDFQRACPAIKKSEKATIRTRAGGEYSYKFAPLDEIMSTILPVMGGLGLSVSYRVSHGKDSVVAVCRVSHEMGHHEESGEVSMPVVIDPSGSGANPAQRVGIASSYAKRYALLAIVGLAPESDDDGKESPPPKVAMPRRQSEPEEPPPIDVEPEPADEDRVWVGKILKVNVRKGVTKGKDWTLYTLVTGDAQEFGTFSETDAEFARQAGSNRVQIVWEKTEKGGLKVLSIGPFEEGADGAA